jgi:hypothetical protein
MTNTRDRSPYAGLALVFATLFGLLLWAGVTYAVIPKNWIIWPIAHGCGAVVGPECKARRSSQWC